VLTDRDRVAAARRARASGARAIVLDDGFQHLRLARDLDVVLLSADDPFPGRVLPRGPYRETEEALARADVVLVTRRAAPEEAAVDVARRASAVAPRAVTAGLSLEPDSLASLDSWLGCTPARNTRYGETLSVSSGGDSVLAVCGVGRPEAFRSSTVALVGGEVELMAFPDHHPFGPADVERIRRRAGGRPVVLTEKDAVKLGRHASEIRPALVLLEQPRWSWGEAELDAVLGSLVEEHVGR